MNLKAYNSTRFKNHKAAEIEDAVFCILRNIEEEDVETAVGIAENSLASIGSGEVLQYLLCDGDGEVRKRRLADGTWVYEEDTTRAYQIEYAKTDRHEQTVIARSKEEAVEKFMGLYANRRSEVVIKEVKETTPHT